MRRNAFVLVLALGPLTPGTTALAASVDVVALEGRCEILITQGKDFSEYCDSRLLNAGHENGRIGFHFFISDKAILTISGSDLPNPTPHTDETLVDLVLVNLGIEGIPPSEAKAFGKCEYENPYLGKPAVIACNGTMEDGFPLQARFVTDGGEPRLLSDLELGELPSGVLEALSPNSANQPNRD